MSRAATTDRFPAGARVGVLTTQPLDRVLDYVAPEGGCVPGDFVEVPLGPRRVLGVIWGSGAGDVDAARLRAVGRVLDLPPMRPELRAFLQRAADYTMTPLPAMLRLATRAPGLGAPPAMLRMLHPAGPEPARMTPARQRVLDAFDEVGGTGLRPSELSARAGVSASVVKGLIEAGTLTEREAPRDEPFAALDPSRPGKALTRTQEAGRAALEHHQTGRRFSTALLQGVTGSGKTEVYLEAVAACLRAGRQALVMLPEIALTAEFLSRVEARFGARPAEWHSGATQAERRRVWHMVARNAAQMVIGARSALFLPFADLGLIVVDEEHDAAYKQEEGALYHARDMAVLRASLAQAHVVLASATPSLETWVNARSGKYARVVLPHRFGKAVMPKLGAIDLRADPAPAGSWISPRLAGAVRDRLDAGEQSLLFLNRRGYAPLTLCRACGEAVGCAECDAAMVEHRFRRELMCHQCGATRPVPQSCPTCQATGRMTAVGPGVERLAEETAALFPAARVAVLSSDLFTSAGALKAEIAAIAQGAADIVIGTQLVAKGHNFPNLTLAGVIDADLGLQGADLRAAERTFQLMRQVAGRAGRAERPGAALLQTFQPEHPVIKAILTGDEDAFWAAEAAARKTARMPPFTRLAAIILSGSDQTAVMALGQHLARASRPLTDIGADVFGPAPAPIARVRGRYRVRLLVRADRSAPLQRALSAWIAPLKLSGDLRLAVDIDPQSFF